MIMLAIIIVLFIICFCGVIYEYHYWKEIERLSGGHYKCSCYDTTNLWRFWRSHYKSSKYYKPLTIKFDDDSEMTI